MAELDAWRAWRRDVVGDCGFVPTMGALHQGHASLVRRARAENTFVVASIYVNPTQFDQAADLAAYPSTLDADLEMLRSLGTDCVLMPRYEQIYADGYRFKVEESTFSRELCGAHRPGHFDGVLTVVMRLLNIVRPTRAYFGEKDYQQFLLIRDMAKAFFMDTDIVPCATVREADGLACSSRNLRLDANARRMAPELHRALCSRDDDAAVSARLRSLGFDVDYIVTAHGRRFGAARVPVGTDSVRLIDNVEFGR